MKVYVIIPLYKVGAGCITTQHGMPRVVDSPEKIKPTIADIERYDDVEYCDVEECELE